MKKLIKKWFDGDSGKFSDGTNFRLSGYNAPERGRKGSSTATRRAAGMTGRSQGYVNWKPATKDKYGRQVGEMKNNQK